MSDTIPGAFDALIAFLDDAPLGLVQTTADGRIQRLNPTGARQLLAWGSAQGPANLFDLLAETAPGLRELAAGQGEPGEVLCRGLPLSTGQTPEAPQALRLSLMRLDQHHLLARLCEAPAPQSIDASAKGTPQRADSARTDSLTHVGNRSVALERIEMAMNRASADPSRQFAVLFINCDRFSRVNVMLGPTGGDELLRQMASRLNGFVRLSDAVTRSSEPAHTTARLGGDEFVVLIEGLRRADDTPGVAQRITDVLSKTYHIAGQTVHCTASVGVVVGDQAAGDADSVLHDASLAMREAKRAGGARYCVFDPALKALAQQRGSLESDLREGLADKQFYVVYQPIVGLSAGTGQAQGVEALVRWKHPVRGQVPPIEFIGIAEECGLIGQLGGLVLNAACHQFVRWQAELGDLAPQLLSVNLSRAQLLEPTLLEDVRHALGSSGLPGKHLQLEITESLAAQDEIIQSRLHGLKTLGLSLALDDFGTGYSSLASLHLMPVDVVKIDRSFVSQIETSRHHQVLIEATVQVARSLGMLTVAEGIETAGQAAVLQALHCDKGQGYFYARPMPADEVKHWLITRSAQAGPDTGQRSPGDARPGPAEAETEAPHAKDTSPPGHATPVQLKLLDSLEQTTVAVGLFDPAERLVYANPSYLEIYWKGQPGQPSWEDVMRLAHRSGRGVVIDTPDIEAWLANVRRRYRQTPRRAFESDISDGRWLRVTEETRADGWQLCMATDVTSLKTHEAALRRARDQAVLASVTDPLTELPNRRHVFERLAERLSESQSLRVPLTVAVIDLDEFKSINDTHGHAVGDQVLVAFAQALKSTVRQRDTVGRVGGEEFLMVLANTGQQGAERVLGQLRSAMRDHPLTVLVPGLRIGFSAGVTEAAHGDDVESICQRADVALYEAKAGGRGQDQFAPPVASPDPVTQRRTAADSDPETGHKTP